MLLETQEKSTFSERLSAAMVKAGKKQVDLVRETGLNKSSVSRYLSGEYAPGYEALKLLSNALDVDMQWLYGGEIPKENAYTRQLNERVRDDFKFSAIVDRLASLDDDKLALIELLLDTLDAPTSTHINRKG